MDELGDEILRSPDSWGVACISDGRSQQSPRLDRRSAISAISLHHPDIRQCGVAQPFQYESGARPSRGPSAHVGRWHRRGQLVDEDAAVTRRIGPLRWEGADSLSQNYRRIATVGRRSEVLTWRAWVRSGSLPSAGG